MSIRAKFLAWVDVLMRVAPLFLLDEILKMNLFNENSSSTQLGNLTNFDTINDTIGADTALNQTELIASTFDFYGLSITLFKCLIFLIGEFSRTTFGTQVAEKMMMIRTLYIHTTMKENEKTHMGDSTAHENRSTKCFCE
jgi:hypothetical protein